MVRFSGHICLLLTWSWYEACMGNPLLAGLMIYEKAMLLWDGVESANDFVQSKPHKPSQADFYNELRSLHNDIKDFDYKIVNDLLTFALRNKYAMKASEFFGPTKEIRYAYNSFADYIEQSDKYENVTIESFAIHCTSENFRKTVYQMLESLIEADSEGDNLFTIIMRKITDRDLMCKKQESQQQLIINLYQAYINLSSKGLILILYSYEMRSRFEKRRFTSERKGWKERYKTSVKKTSEAIIEALKRSSREIRRCDPSKHERGVTYDKLQGIFQAYAVYKPDIQEFSFPYYSYCSTVRASRLDCQSTTCTAQPTERRCTGFLRDCQTVVKSSQICHSPPGSERRYEWLKGDMDKMNLEYGKHHSGNCDNRTQNLHANFFLPKTCLCNCESEAREVDRYFSLQQVLSDVQDNKAVTGVRLIKDNHVFHIQIKQGTLGPNATIIDEPKWKSVSSISTAQLLDRKISRVIKATEREPEKVKFLENDLVYAVTYDNSEVFLEILDAHDYLYKDKVVTGLKFERYRESLLLKVQFTDFEYTTGKLNNAGSDWEYSSYIRRSRQEVVLQEPGDPTDFHDSSDFSRYNQRIRFKISEMKNDFGQNTIPFIDIQEVTTNPPMPLSGIGLIHRGRRASGGFLALQVIHVDYTDHVENVVVF